MRDPRVDEDGDARGGPAGRQGREDPRRGGPGRERGRRARDARLTPAGGGKLIRVRHFRVACAALAVAASGVAPFACSSPPALLGAGGQCFQTTDCQEGLFCVQQPGGKASTCSADLASTVSTEEGGATLRCKSARMGVTPPPPKEAAPTVRRPLRPLMVRPPTSARSRRRTRGRRQRTRSPPQGGRAP